jgi:hypothetical protein
MAFINRIFKIKMYKFCCTSDDFYKGTFKIKINSKSIVIYDNIHNMIPIYIYYLSSKNYYDNVIPYVDSLISIKKDLMKLNNKKCIFYYEYGKRKIKDLNKNSGVNRPTNIFAEDGGSMIDCIEGILNDNNFIWRKSK